MSSAFNIALEGPCVVGKMWIYEQSFTINADVEWSTAEMKG